MPRNTAQPLYSMDDIGTGKQWPPPRRAGLNKKWASYSRYLEDDFNGFVTKNTKPTSESRFNTNYDKERVETNYFSIITSFWRESVVPARIEITVPNARTQDFVDALHDSLLVALRQVVIDEVLNGVGVFDNRMLLAPRAVNPQFWFPVRAPYDYDMAIGDIIAYPYIEENIAFADRIRIIKIENGLASETSHVLAANSIGNQLSIEADKNSYQVSGYSVIPFTLNNSLYGVSHFDKHITQIREIHIRESAIAESMDRASDPHLAMPDSAIPTDDEGNTKIDLRGMVIPMSENDKHPSYISYTPDFSSQETAIKRLRMNIWLAEGIDPTLIEEAQGSNNIPMSGAALRRLSVVTTQRIRSYWEALKLPLQQLVLGQIELTALSEGMETVPMVDIDDIEIDFGQPLYVLEDNTSYDEEPDTAQTGVVESEPSLTEQGE